jgi:hypothetical protein
MLMNTLDAIPNKTSSELDLRLLTGTMAGLPDASDFLGDFEGEGGAGRSWALSAAPEPRAKSTEKEPAVLGIAS